MILEHCGCTNSKARNSMLRVKQEITNSNDSKPFLSNKINTQKTGDQTYSNNPTNYFTYCLRALTESNKKKNMILHP